MGLSESTSKLINEPIQNLIGTCIIVIVKLNVGRVLRLKSTPHTQS